MSNEQSRGNLPIKLFVDQAAFDAWILAQSRDCPGLWLRLPKKDGGIASTLTRAEAIDVALCHGWIDGQLDRFDNASYLIRFTPRRAKSKWSLINARRTVELAAAGKMRPAGQAEIDAAKSDGRWDAAYAPQGSATVPDDLRAALDANPQASAFFATLSGANRYAILYRVNTVKKAQTRARKIQDFVAMCERGEVLHPKK